ncbi:BMP family ABC transporter substrate-binding protein [Nitratireductor mangrovi]|uniref:BMP family ABC transporter substrate-binding protein n=1 Tax=Nitratireductor mangrovi TaxID=2599600 RepID=A0A5B8L0B0_9HYPH|nr:BMP family protein [Nitratireductor mangrovi]QDZ01301.1 BMP family ABC transporter substrate-binding protein [Nitratireductor mangrovi]
MTKLLATTALAMVTLLSAAHADTKRVALVLPGPITDGTFNSAASKGIEAAKEKYDIEVVVRENTDFAQIQDVLRSYAEEGYDMVIGHGFQFAEPVMAIHAEYPQTFFVVNTAQVAAEPNVASFDNRWGDAGYMAGAVAALYSKSGKIGHVGAIPVPVIEQYNLGFERGAKYFRPEVQVLSAYVGSFSDIARGAEITTSLIEQGADVVTSTGNENVMGTIQAAQKANVSAIGTAFDSAAMAPDTIITTALINMDVNIDLAVGRFIEGTLKPQTYVLGLKENGIGLAPLRGFENKISAEDKAKIDALVTDIAEGRITDLP